MRRYGELALALLLIVIGAGGALLVSRADWQVITTRLPQRVDVVDLTGRDVDAASTALALVGLAGVVAVLATRSVWRQVVGVVVAVAGAGLVWRGVASSGAVDASRARSLVESRHPTVSVGSATAQRIEVHGVWPVLSVVAGVVVLLAGLLVALRGGRWQGMSSRYSATPDRHDARTAGAAPAGDPDGEQADEAKAAATMWSALDRGEDPTSDPGSS